LRDAYGPGYLGWASRAGLKTPVSIDAVLDALCELDGGPRHPPGGKPKCRFSTARAIRLPRHVIDRLEHRWASRLRQDAAVWSIDRPVQARHVQTNGARAIPVIIKRARFARCDALWGSR
jgi:hypothetical protein